jgi:hypothetical protein
MLDHIGVILERLGVVDQMYQKAEPPLTQLGGRVVNSPKLHCDGSDSFYFSNPDGTVF